MFLKIFRRLLKPIYIQWYNSKISKSRRNSSANTEYDKSIPDQRISFQSVDDQIKHIGLRILRILQDISEKNNLQFTLSYGTLLGAIRHKGFIPWDDDIDIFMTQEEFNQLVTLANLFPNSIMFTTMDVGFFKLMDKSSIVSFDKKRGVAVDIFIIKKKRDSLSFFNVHTLRNHTILTEDYYPLKMHQFEEYQFNIPSNFDTILSGIYGDYMKLPPIEQQVSQHSDIRSITINPYGEFLVDEKDVI